MTNSQITLNQEQVQNQDIRKIFLFAFLSLLMYVFVIYYLFITFIILLIQKSIASILRRIFFPESELYYIPQLQFISNKSLYVLH